MAARKQVGWQKLVLILTVIPCCWSLHVSIPEKEYKIAKGSDVTLTCSFKPAAPVQTNFLLTWEAYPDVTGNPLKTVASYFLNSPIDIAPAYEGRVSLEVDIARGTSRLYFTKVTMEDNRTFQCSVKIPGDDEGTTAASTSLLVLEPPSPPVCKLQGKAEYFNDISLTCLSEEGSPPPVYQWTSYSVENIPRQFPPKTTQKDGVLSLFNISRETSGFFICVSENEIGSAKCNFTLAVMPGSMSMGSTGIIIGGVLAGVLVVGILIFCFCRRKVKKDKYTEGSPGEMEFHDKDGAEAGRQYLDDESNVEKNKVDQYEDKDVPKSSYSTGGVERRFDDDQYSYSSGRKEGKGSDTGSQRYPDDQHDSYRGSRDRLEDQRDRYGSRDRLEDNRERYGSRDRLEDNRERYGSRDRLEDNRERYGSRDRLEDNRERYGSRDRLEDNRERYGSRDRLDDNRERYGSRDRLDDRRDHYGGSRDNLDGHGDRCRGSHDHLNSHANRYGGSRDRLDNSDGPYSQYD